MVDYIYEGTRQVAYIKNGFAFDQQQRRRYSVESGRLLDISTRSAVAYLTQAGIPGTVAKADLFS